MEFDGGVYNRRVKETTTQYRPLGRNRDPRGQQESYRETELNHDSKEHDMDDIEYCANCDEPVRPGDLWRTHRGNLACGECAATLRDECGKSITHLTNY